MVTAIQKEDYGDFLIVVIVPLNLCNLVSTDYPDRRGLNCLKTVHINEIEIVGHIPAHCQPMFYCPSCLFFQVHEQSLVQRHPEREIIPCFIKNDLVRFDKFGYQTP